MTTINPLNQSLYWQEQTTPVDDSPNSQMLQQEDFFALLSTQLSMQDPFKPVDNDQMIAQMASFAQVDGINNLNSEIGGLNSLLTSSQALEASSLVGKKVLLPSSSGYLSAQTGEMAGVISVPSGVQVSSVRVENASGQVVATVKVPAGQEGNIDFSWDGKTSGGEMAPEGIYTFAAEANVDGTKQALAISTYAHVSSVSLGTPETGAVLNLRGLGGILLTDVLAVTESDS